MEIKPSCMMTPRMHLLPKTLLPWTIHHHNAVCPNKIVNHLPNIVRTPILAVISPNWNLPPTHIHMLKNWHNLLTNYSNSP